MHPVPQWFISTENPVSSIEFSFGPESASCFDAHPSIKSGSRPAVRRAGCKSLFWLRSHLVFVLISSQIPQEHVDVGWGYSEKQAEHSLWRIYYVLKSVCRCIHTCTTFLTHTHTHRGGFKLFVRLFSTFYQTHAGSPVLTAKRSANTITRPVFVCCDIQFTVHAFISVHQSHNVAKTHSSRVLTAPRSISTHRVWQWRIPNKTDPANVRSVCQTVCVQSSGSAFHSACEWFSSSKWR